MTEKHTLRLADPSAIDSIISVDEFLQIKEQYDAEQPLITLQTKFNLAWALVRSDSTQHVQQGLSLFCSIYKDSPERRLECLYYIALSHYKLKQYEESRRYLNMLLSKDPNSPEALKLKNRLYDAVTKGMFILIKLNEVSHMHECCVYVRKMRYK